jgi:DNA-binding Xre family transcriptional regulator
MPDRATTADSPPETRVYTARGPVDGEDWPAVAHALNARMATLRIGQQELAVRSGVSVSTLRQLQHGASRRVQNKTLTAISTALDWPADHLTGVLLHPHQPSTGTATPQQALAVLARIEQRLDALDARLHGIEALLRGPGR